LRPSPGFHHVYRHQPIPRCSGSRTEVLAVAGELERRVYPGCARKSRAPQRHRPLRAVHCSAGCESPGSISLGHHFLNLAPGVALSDASRAILTMEQKMGMPSTITGMFSGTLQAFQSSLATEPFLIITALMAVYIV